MKINHKFFSLPPYISTQWNHVKGLYMRGGVLVINLTCGETIQIPGLDAVLIEQVFAAHAAFLDQEPVTGPELSGAWPKEDIVLPSKEQLETFMHFSTAAGEGFTSLMQHNGEQSNAPELPKEMLEKIQSIMQILAPEEVSALGTPKQGCNCPHCQITRAITGDKEEPTMLQQEPEPEVSEEELHFEQWKIEQTGENLYRVTNKLDPVEEYQVFLGHPVGCTCGNEGCEHILAVLKS
jgi:hypothetical protein